MDKISPIKERILHFLEYKGIAKTEFCEKTGISYANMKGKSLISEIGGGQIGEILSIYSEISAEWLLTGKGQMLKGYAEIIPDVVSESIKKYNTCIQCEAKDLLIKEKDERIAELKEMISILKGKNDCESKRHSA
jgi:hypothetical protein